MSMTRLQFTNILATQVEAGTRTRESAAAELVKFAAEQSGNPRALTVFGAQIELDDVLNGTSQGPKKWSL